MAEQVKLDAKADQIHMIVDGRTITLCFSSDYNPTLAPLVKETLLDSFLRKNGIGESNVTAGIPISPVHG